jgi:hypothetical protein
MAETNPLHRRMVSHGDATGPRPMSNGHDGRNLSPATQISYVHLYQ